MILKVTRETDPCPRMDEQFQGLTNALLSNWRGSENSGLSLETNHTPIFQ